MAEKKQHMKKQPVTEDNFLLSIRNFFKDSVNSILKRYAKGFLRYGTISVLMVVCLYLVLKFLFGWDVLYETNFPFQTVFFSFCIIFFALALTTMIIAFVLYNTKYVRGTKYVSKKGNNMS